MPQFSKAKQTVTFTKDEIKEALKSHYNLTGEILTVDQVTKHIEIPRLDPHDCDYRYEFDGVKVIIED